jgi:hypothetical protein
MSGPTFLQHLLRLGAVASLYSRAYILVPAQAYVGKFLETFKTFPPAETGELHRRRADGGAGEIACRGCRARTTGAGQQ